MDLEANGSIVVSLIWFWFLLLCNLMASDLSLLNVEWFSSAHSYIFCASAVHSVTPVNQLFHCVPSIVLSHLHVISNISICASRVSMSIYLIITRNNRGQRTDPCGTPDFTFLLLDSAEPTLTLFSLFNKNSQIHFQTYPLMLTLWNFF